MSSKDRSTSPTPNEASTPVDEDNAAVENKTVVQTADSTGGQRGFQRGQIVWGRPPQAVFRAGPLPRDEGMARLMAMPPYPKPSNAPANPLANRPAGQGGAGAGGIGFGSNIPQKSAQPTVSPRNTVSNTAAKPAAPQAAGIGVMQGSLVPVARAKAPDSAPVQNPAPASQPKIEAGDATNQASIVPERVILPAVEAEPIIPVVEPAKPEPVAVKAEKTQSASGFKPSPVMWLVMGLGVLLVAAGIFWMATNASDTPATQEVLTVPENTPDAMINSAAPAAVEPNETEAVEATPDVPVVATPAPRLPLPVATVTTPREQAAPAPAPVPAPAPSRPAAVAPPASTAPTQEAPPVVVAPVEAPAETATPASPVNQDPNAPLVTRPQRLD